MGMKHNRKGRYLGRTGAERHALYRNLLVSAVEHERIKTTEAKAKEIQPMLEKLITTARVDTPHNRAQIMSALNNKLLTAKLFEYIAPRFINRNGGYSRIYQLGYRLGDHAHICLLEILES